MVTVYQKESFPNKESNTKILQSMYLAYIIRSHSKRMMIMEYLFVHTFSVVLLTLNAPLHIVKCTPRGRYTPVWEPLQYMITEYVWSCWRHLQLLFLEPRYVQHCLHVVETMKCTSGNSSRVQQRVLQRLVTNVMLPWTRVHVTYGTTWV